MSIEVWAIYSQPDDFPEHVVVRIWDVHPHPQIGLVPREVGCLCATLGEAREQIPPGMVRLERQRSDVAAVTEVWV